MRQPDHYLQSFGALEQFNKAFNEIYRKSTEEHRPLMAVQDEPEVAIRTPEEPTETQPRR